MSGTIFFVCWMSWTSRCFPAAMLFQTESRVSCPRRSLNVLRKRGRQWRNRDHWIWCRGTSWVRRQILRKILSDPNSLVNQQLDQSSVSSPRQELDAKHQPKRNNVCSREATRWHSIFQHQETGTRDEPTSPARARKLERGEDSQIGRTKLHLHKM